MPSPHDVLLRSPTITSAIGGPAVKAGRQVFSGFESLPADRCLEIYRLMVRTRALEERTIKMSKSGEGYFWVGGPGEEAFNVCLGLQVKKGRGPGLRLPPPALPQRRRPARDGHADGRPRPPDGDDGHRPALAGPQLRRPLRHARSGTSCRSPA